MATNEAEMDYGVENLKQNMISLFNHRKNADLTLVCGSQSFKIHSFILCPRSTFFRAALEGGFKEGLAKRIELPEDNPHLISQLICYCYTTDYKFDGRHIDMAMEIQDPFDFPLYLHPHAGMYAMAEKFDLKNLKKLAEKKFGSALSFFEAFLPMVASGNKPPFQILDVIRLIYSTTPENDRGLRDLVVRTVAQHWYYFLAFPQFKTFMAANTDFIIDVIEAKESSCSRCEKHAALEKACSSLKT